MAASCCCLDCHRFVGSWCTYFFCRRVVSPSPFDYFRSVKRCFTNFYTTFYFDLTLSVFGFVIGATVGLIVATFLHLSKWGRETFYPFLILSQNIPIIVFAPLLVIWFGFGALPKLIVITLACFFPIAVSALGGLQQTSRELNLYMNMMGASKSQIFWKLELPH